ncbi:helix-turn-helix domain-containing protein [Paenibacillus sp. LMG 31458]|uniref:Helix-turn-helix domain-containing protein n=1 Tax=Paenibacillus phytorum TaxID=2654977 RepID=A0ABX1Y2Z0_9BACL|nr:AraC family transcriptional regulator [Paenibacillus phytorum]NOU75183.1 helix-turn-helix domain-containing protein [Paenibacillus phytorum]
MKTKWKMVANKGFLQIFSALLLVVIIMFVSNYLVYKNSLSSIYHQVSENNKLVVKNLIRSFDDVFKDINDIIYMVQSSNNIWGSFEGDSVDFSEASKLYKDIRPFISSNEYIEEIVVFHNNFDIAVTSAGTISLEELFRKKFNNITYNANFWKTLMSKPHPLQVFPAQWYSGSGSDSEGKRKLIVLTGNNKTYNQNILIFLNVNKLLQHVNQAAMMQGSTLIVMDENRNMFLNTEESWNLVEVLNDLNIRTGPEATLKKKDFEYNVYKSDFNEFIYINKAPYEFTNLQSVTDANRQIIMIAIACAVLLSAFLSLYLYKPIRVILKLMGVMDQRGADFRNILTGIAKIQDENELIKARLTGVNWEMRRSAFLNTLDDDSRSQEAELRMQQYFAEFFQSKYFLMADFQLRLNPNSEQTEMLQIEEFVHAIQTGLEERVGKTFVFHMTNMRFIAEIAIHHPSDREHVVKQLKSFVKQVQEDGWLCSSMLTGISRLYSTKTVNCHKAYRDLTECLLYRNIHADDLVTDFQAIRYTWKVYVPLNEIERASNFLVSGNEAECIQIIDHVFTTNVERQIHHYQLMPIAKTIFYYMVKHLDTSDFESKDILALELEFNQKVEAAFSYESIRGALVQAIRVIMEHNKTEQKRKLNPTSIATYIELNYMKNLHLDHMAEMLETSPKYFSSYFKKTFDINFVEYLNRVRLSHAKELLKKTELSVAEIGEKTGYLNSSTFTSTFKKYHGISPSDYRKNILA